MNQALRPLISKFVIVYFDDIHIFSTDLDEHLSNLKTSRTFCDKNVFLGAEHISFCVLSSQTRVWILTKSKLLNHD